MIARGAVTCWNSPRGLGKTLVAHHLAVDMARQGHRVLLIDRDNPRREVRRRLKAWGLDGLEPGRLKVIPREDAPPLTDTAGWRAFPVAEYDVLILDSLGSASEGTGEQDSRRPSLAMAALLDVVRATRGPAALVLDNTVKKGTHGRGSGVIEDRLDIVYEVRDATGFVPTGKRGAWWLELPASGRDAWGERASRRKRRDTYRLAFVPSKFRVGAEPEPFALEITCAQEPWKCADVTAQLAQEGQDSRRDRLEGAAAAVLEKVRAAWRVGRPWSVNADAVPLLIDRGIARDEARALLKDRAGKDWEITGGGRRGDPMLLMPIASEESSAGNPATESTRHSPTETVPSLADFDPQRPQESTRMEPATDAGNRNGDLLRKTPETPFAGLVTGHDWAGHERGDRARREAAILAELGDPKLAKLLTDAHAQWEPLEPKGPATDRTDTPGHD
jgi:hypothetical protein